MERTGQTLTVACSYCAWSTQQPAPDARGAVTVARRLRAQLIAHCEQTHPDIFAGPPPDGAPQPPTTAPDPVEALRTQLDVYQAALQRIATQTKLSAAKRVAANALLGVAPRRGWNRST